MWGKIVHQPDEIQHVFRNAVEGVFHSPGVQSVLNDMNMHRINTNLHMDFYRGVVENFQKELPFYRSLGEQIKNDMVFYRGLAESLGEQIKNDMVFYRGLAEDLRGGLAELRGNQRGGLAELRGGFCMMKNTFIFICVVGAFAFTYKYLQQSGNNGGGGGSNKDDH